MNHMAETCSLNIARNFSDLNYKSSIQAFWWPPSSSSIIPERSKDFDCSMVFSYLKNCNAFWTTINNLEGFVYVNCWKYCLAVRSMIYNLIITQIVFIPLWLADLALLQWYIRIESTANPDASGCNNLAQPASRLNDGRDKWDCIVA